MSITSYGSCSHLISSGGISFTAICTHKEALAIELALNIAAGTAEAQTKTSTNSAIMQHADCTKCRWSYCCSSTIDNGVCKVIFEPRAAK